MNELTTKTTPTPKTPLAGGAGASLYSRTG